MAARKKSSSTGKIHRVHKQLHAPVHNMVGYLALLLLAIVVLVLVYSLQWYIIP